MTDEMIESALKQAAELRAKFDHLKNRPTYPIHLGWGVLYSDREFDKYEPCPCESGDKYKFCCWKRTKNFRFFLKKHTNTLFIDK